MSTTKLTAKKYIQECLLSREGKASERFKVSIHESYFEEDGVPETAVMARKRLYSRQFQLTAIIFNFLSLAPHVQWK